jgi:hypothetical protein
MKTSETHTPHKLGANRHDPAQREHHAKHPSAESRDVREDRSTRKSKMVTSVPHQPSGELRTSGQLLARESDRPWAKSLAEHSVAPAAPEAKRLTFRHDTAAEVFVAGSFNHWLPSRDALKRTATGEWSIDLALAPGRYEYLFVADGRWLEDPNALEAVANPYGGHNSVVVL